jgi:dipeptidyl aminopeptidase/acylaminoacyl peptidase
MKTGVKWGRLGSIVLWLCAPVCVRAQGTPADYLNGANLRAQSQGLVYNSPETAAWIGRSHRFWYRKTVKGGNEFWVVDANALLKRPAFDHEKLASALSLASGQRYTGKTLPFNTLSFAADDTGIEFLAAGSSWRCDFFAYACAKIGSAAVPEPTGQGDASPTAPPGGSQAEPGPRVSPDGRLEASIRNFNVFVRSRASGEETQLSWDGTEADYYSWNMQWSPDSSKLAVFRTRPGYKRLVHFIESSPADQLQPKTFSIEYNKPGDDLDINMPVLFHVAAKKQINIDDRLFATPYSNGLLRWWNDSRAFTFEYNQRGHQVYRVIEVNATTGAPRALISEETKTFFCYSDRAKNFRHDVNDGREIIWASERDGWNHLYLYDAVSGTVKNQITKGEWAVRGVEWVDETRRQIWFQAGGAAPGKDPYFIHYYRINFDGTGLVALTEVDGNHTVVFPAFTKMRAGGTGSFSADMMYYLDVYSRVDLPPVMELHRTADQKMIMEVERADMQDLIRSGWAPPEAFVAKGRDGKTDIWGVIYRPRNLDPLRKYPVIENIYTGPQSSWVPKSFSVYDAMQSLAELGFIVVQVDGMGTNNRSKAFHDVCWKNLGDGGFPDRIRWHKAVAAKYPYYDISRVGIYGTSAGGQSAMGALLFHPEFYKVAVSNSGCHDNRLDKLSSTEQWMGYPVGPEYAAASNVENARKLQGKLLLVAGELDINVDPSSTLQVVNALIRANKVFDFLYVPGGGHGAGGEYGDRKRNDFFVHYLLGVEPPDWNQIAARQK